MPPSICYLFFHNPMDIARINKKKCQGISKNGMLVVPFKK
jgi:hypothetical protein